MLNRRIVAVVVVLVLLVSGAFLLLNPNTPCCATSTVVDISPTEYQSQFVASSANHLLLDVRTPEEFTSGHIQNAVNISVESLASRLSEVPTGQPIVIYCRSGNRSAQASQILAQAGYTTLYDLGGLNDWTAQGFPVE